MSFINGPEHVAYGSLDSKYEFVLCDYNSVSVYRSFIIYSHTTRWNFYGVFKIYVVGCSITSSNWSICYRYDVSPASTD